jgi:hypothetical protein
MCGWVRLPLVQNCFKIVFSMSPLEDQLKLNNPMERLVEKILPIEKRSGDYLSINLIITTIMFD